MSGSNSTSTLKARSAGWSAASGMVFTSTLGCVAGRRPRSDSTCWVASLTLSSSTSDHHGAAVALAQHAVRHLAGAEAGQLHLAADLAELGGAAVLDGGGRHDDVEAALQPFGEGLGNLHGGNFLGEIVVKDGRWGGRADSGRASGPQLPTGAGEGT